MQKADGRKRVKKGPPVNAGALRRLRYAQGLTVRELSALSGVTAATISRLEKRHHRYAHATTLRKLAGALGVPTATLVDLRRLPTVKGAPDMRTDTRRT